MKRLIILMAVALVAASCNKNLSETDQQGQGSRYADISSVSHEMIVLGDKLQDPYSVDNVKAAIASLYPTKGGVVELQPTDYYVRFLPETEEQYAAIESLGIRMTDHPLDYEIVKEGDYYHDPEVPEGQITWQYAVISPDQELPAGVKYEILDHCYIPSTGSSTRAAGDIDWDAVERESYRLTGNESLLLPQTKDGATAVAPEGRITIVDDGIDGGQESGLEGVEVWCNSFVKFGKATTDSYGYYEMNKTFSSDPRYRIVFKNKRGFAIGFNLVLIPASVSTLGTASAEGLDVRIDRDSDKKLFTRAAVNNAACDYYQKCESLGLPTPPDDTRIWILYQMTSSSTLMLKHGAVVDNDLVAGYLGDWADLLKTFLPDITLGAHELTTYSDIYAKVIHELAHASHFSVTGRAYWENFIKYILTSNVTFGGLYGNGTINGSGYCAVGEMWSYTAENILYNERYTDQLRTSGYDYWFRPQVLMALYEDGMTLAQFAQVLGNDVHDVNTFRSTLKETFPEWETFIDQAFDRYL